MYEDDYYYNIPPYYDESFLATESGSSSGSGRGHSGHGHGHSHGHHHSSNNSNGSQHHHHHSSSSPHNHPSSHHRGVSGVQSILRHNASLPDQFVNITSGLGPSPGATTTAPRIHSHPVINHNAAQQHQQQQRHAPPSDVTSVNSGQLSDNTHLNAAINRANTSVPGQNPFAGGLVDTGGEVSSDSGPPPSGEGVAQYATAMSNLSFTEFNENADGSGFSHHTSHTHTHPHHHNNNRSPGQGRLITPENANNPRHPHILYQDSLNAHYEQHPRPFGHSVPNRDTITIDPDDVVNHVPHHTQHSSHHHHGSDETNHPHPHLKRQTHESDPRHHRHHNNNSDVLPEQDFLNFIDRHNRSIPDNASPISSSHHDLISRNVPSAPPHGTFHLTQPMPRPFTPPPVFHPLEDTAVTHLHSPEHEAHIRHQIQQAHRHHLLHPEDFTRNERRSTAAINAGIRMNQNTGPTTGTLKGSMMDINSHVPPGSHTSFDSGPPPSGGLGFDPTIGELAGISHSGDEQTNREGQANELTDLHSRFNDPNAFDPNLRHIDTHTMSIDSSGHPHSSSTTTAAPKDELASVAHDQYDPSNPQFTAGNEIATAGILGFHELMNKHPHSTTNVLTMPSHVLHNPYAHNRHHVLPPLNQHFDSDSTGAIVGGEHPHLQDFGALTGSNQPQVEDLGSYIQSRHPEDFGAATHLRRDTGANLLPALGGIGAAGAAGAVASHFFGGSPPGAGLGENINQDLAPDEAEHLGLDIAPKMTDSSIIPHNGPAGERTGLPEVKAQGQDPIGDFFNFLQEGAKSIGDAIKGYKPPGLSGIEGGRGGGGGMDPFIAGMAVESYAAKSTVTSHQHSKNNSNSHPNSVPAHTHEQQHHTAASDHISYADLTHTDVGIHHLKTVPEVRQGGLKILQEENKKALEEKSHANLAIGGAMNSIPSGLPKRQHGKGKLGVHAHLAKEGDNLNKNQYINYMNDILGQLKQNSYLFMDAGLIGVGALLLLPKVGIRAIPSSFNKIAWTAAVSSLAIGLLGHMANPSGRAFAGREGGGHEGGHGGGGGFHGGGEHFGGHEGFHGDRGFHGGDWHGGRGWRGGYWPGYYGGYPYPYDPYPPAIPEPYPYYGGYYPGWYGGRWHGDGWRRGGHFGGHEGHEGGHREGGGGGGHEGGHEGGHGGHGHANLAKSYFAPAIFPDRSYFNHRSSFHSPKQKRMINPSNVILPHEIDTSHYILGSRPAIIDNNQVPFHVLSDIY